MMMMMMMMMRKRLIGLTSNLVRKHMLPTCQVRQDAGLGFQDH